MNMNDIITKKRDNLKLSKEEIEYFINGYVNGTIPDYQASALLMAIYFNGMDDQEISTLTQTMLDSGEKIDLSSIDGICVDKHSTGGVGDKTSLVVGPIVASCGLKLAKMSGRGLGHTGGTLDKLESIPGFNVFLTKDQFFNQVKEIGLAIIGQTANICPADKKLYALRDVTGTVASIPLIASSIMSKKLASGAKTIVLDVKVGEGSFMKTVEQATKLSNILVSIGKNASDFKRNVIAVLTDMNEPLGQMVGNSLEVIEAIETLKGRGPKRFEELCVKASIELLLESGYVKSEEEARKKVMDSIQDGSALEKLRQMIEYQGGNPKVIDDYSLFPQASKVIEYVSPQSGYIEEVNALKIGVAAMYLGAGRQSKEDSIDPSVGIESLRSIGDYVNKGDVLLKVYSNGLGEKEAFDLIKQAYRFSENQVIPKPIILGLIK